MHHGEKEPHWVAPECVMVKRMLRRVLGCSMMHCGVLHHTSWRKGIPLAGPMACCGQTCPTGLLTTHHGQLKSNGGSMTHSGEKEHHWLASQHIMGQ
jgi:hypothetical protein